MKILMSLLLAFLIIITTSYHGYFIWKNKDYKTLIIQIGIVCLTIVAGILVVNDPSYVSISKILNMLSPIEK